MIETPEITKTDERLTAVSHLTIPRDQIQVVMAPGITELMATATAQGIATTGARFHIT